MFKIFGEAKLTVGPFPQIGQDANQVFLCGLMKVLLHVLLSALYHYHSK